MNVNLTIPKHYSVSEQVTYLCQQLKSAGGYDDLIRFLQAKDKDTRHQPRKNKAKSVDVADRYGTKARRGSAGKANMTNPDIVYEEMPSQFVSKLKF